MNISPRGSIVFLLIGVTAIGQLMFGSVRKAAAATEIPQALTCNAISGYVYEDANFDGLRSVNEPPLPNVQVELLNSTDNVIATATTDASGFYSFTIDTTIIQSARHITQSLLIPQRTTDWVQELNINKFDPTLGDLLNVSITTTGDLTTLVRVENTDTAAQVLTATVAARFTTAGPALNNLVAQSPLEFVGVFKADAFDGLIDFAGKSGFVFPTKVVTATSTINLTDPAQLAQYAGTGTLTMTLSTVGSSTAVGSSNVNLLLSTTAVGVLQVDYGYIPSQCVKNGTYTIREQQPPGYTDGFDTDGNVTPIPGSSSGRDTITVQVTTSQDKPNNNFGEWRQASIGGFVYHDVSDEGVFDTNESPIPQVEIQITGLTITGTPLIISATTGLDGSYDFTGLWPGVYTLTEVQPPVWADGKDTQGTPGNGIATNDQFAAIKLDAGVIGKDNNFGELLPPPAMILTKTVGTLPNNCPKTNEITVTAGTPVYYCYTVTNTGPVPLVTHTLIDDKLGVILDNVVINLQPGASTFVTAPATIQITTTNVATWTARPPLGPPVTKITTATVRVPPVQANAALGDYVWMDTDNDGMQDPDEPGAAKTKVTLYSNGAVVTSTVTTWQGYYTFTNLTPGVPYTLNFDYNMKNGMTWTVRYAGGDRAKDSNVDKHGNTEQIILKANEFNRSIDAGIDLGLVIDQVSTDAAVTVGPCPERLITYTLVVDNNGIFTLSDIILQDDVPTNTTYVVGSASVVPTVTASTLVWQLPTLKPGDRFSVSFVVRIALDDATTVVNTAHIGNEDFPVLATTVNSKQLTCSDKPTAISLNRFEAASADGGVRLEWSTLLEQDTLGFALYRSADPQRGHAIRLNPDWIASIGRDGGARYDWVDVTAQPGVAYYYWLQEMTLSGLTNDYGPTQLTLAPPVSVAVAQEAGGGTPLQPKEQPMEIVPTSAAVAPLPTVAPRINNETTVQVVSVEPVVRVTAALIVERATEPIFVSTLDDRKSLDDDGAMMDSVVVATPQATIIAQAEDQSIAKPQGAPQSHVVVSQPHRVAQMAPTPRPILKSRISDASVAPVTTGFWVLQLSLFSAMGAVLVVGLGWLALAAMGRRR